MINCVEKHLLKNGKCKVSVIVCSNVEFILINNSDKCVYFVKGKIYFFQI